MMALPVECVPSAAQRARTSAPAAPSVSSCPTTSSERGGARRPAPSSSVGPLRRYCHRLMPSSGAGASASLPAVDDARSTPAASANVTYQSTMATRASEVARRDASGSAPPARKPGTLTPPSHSVRFEPRSSPFEPPVLTGAPLSESHRKRVVAHMPRRRSASVRLCVASSTSVTIPISLARRLSWEPVYRASRPR